MSTDKRKFSFSEFFTEGQYQTQAEVLEVSEKSKSITIGMPKEDSSDENRIPIVPNSLRALIGHGHKVIVEQGAGDRSYFTDHDYSEAGAELTPDKERVLQCMVVVKASPPTEAEIDMMSEGSILISPIMLPKMTETFLRKLKKKRIISIAMEYLAGESGSFPLVRIMSEIAGMASVFTAAELLSYGCLLYTSPSPRDRG